MVCGGRSESSKVEVTIFCPLCLRPRIRVPKVAIAAGQSSPGIRVLPHSDVIGMERWSVMEVGWKVGGGRCYRFWGDM